MNDDKHAFIVTIICGTVLLLALFASCNHQATKCMETGGEWKGTECTRKP